MTRSVKIYYYDKGYILGFQFFDKDNLPIFKVGNTTSKIGVTKTLVLAKNEVIIGIVCKLYPDRESSYTEFQFLIAAKWD